jgi:hypothetical protein
MSDYQKGSDVTCSVIFRNSSGVITDPTTVTFKVKNPAGTITTYTSGVDVALVHDSTGHYHVDVDANASGTWAYRFSSIGVVKSAAEDTFTVVNSEF